MGADWEKRRRPTQKYVLWVGSSDTYSYSSALCTRPGNPALKLAHSQSLAPRHMTTLPGMLWRSLLSPHLPLPAVPKTL
jgi:hypothetical protein